MINPESLVKYFIIGVGGVLAAAAIKKLYDISKGQRANDAKEIDLTLTQLKLDNDKRSDSELVDHANERDSRDPDSPTYRKE